MSAKPVWFGPAARPLFGWVHRPDSGRARGGVLICPPIGIDQSYADNALRRLARTLEQEGFAVVRFDYDGTGQSAGSMADPDRVTHWLASTRAAVDLLRATGVEWVAGVGLRLGAVLLGRVATETRAFDAVVLWDPYASGKTFVREQRALQLAVRPTRDDAVAHGVEIPGYLLSETAVAELSALSLPTDRGPAERVLALLDPSRTTNDRLAPLLDLPEVDVLEQSTGAGIYDTGQVRFELSTEPLGQIAGWLSAQCGRQATQLPISTHEAAGAVVVETLDDGRTIVEEPLRLGPNQLFGIACDARGPDGATLATGPTILFLSIAAESSIGPARQWVELAREWAALGYRSVRYDFAGIGESPVRPGGVERGIYRADALEDIVDAATAVSPDDPHDVILVGVCSGAYAALAAAPQLRPKGVAAINPLLSFPAFVRAASTTNGAAGGESQSVPLRRLVGALRSVGRGSAWRERVGELLPAPAWRIPFALGVSFSPARILEPIVDANVATLVLCGAEESRIPTRRTPQAVRRLDAARPSRFAVEPALHHSLLHNESRAIVRSTLARFLSEVEAQA